MAHCRIITDENGTPVDYWILRINAAYERIIGVKKADVEGRRVTEVFPDIKDYAFDYIGVYGKIALEGGEIKFEESFEATGQYLEIYAYSPVPGEFAAIFTDVTERKKTEVALEQQALLLDLSSDAIFAWELEGAVTYWNSGAETLYGFSPEEAVGQVSHDLLRTAHPHGFAPFRAALERDGEWMGELAHIAKDGRTLVVETRQQVIDVGGRQLVLETNRDITERKRAEEALRANEERLRLAQQSSNVGVFDWDMKTDVVVWTPELEAVYGLEPGSASAYEDFRKRVHPNDLQAMEERRDAAIRNHESFYLEFRIIRPSGEVRWLIAVGRAFYDMTGQPVRLIGNNVDVTERKQAEEALKESESRLRQLAAENERLYRQQLNIAENLQFALLNIPSEIGPLRIGHLYRSATEAARIGGDFYDVFEVKDGQIAVLIGDVSGHGIEAARTATLVKDVVHAFTHQSLRTHEVLRNTNKLLLEKNLPGFVTAFLGILDQNSGRLRYSLAGHPEALLRRVSGEVERLGFGTSPLGVYPDPGWKTHDVELEADDILLLYTDGVIEARVDGQLFGAKRLENVLKRKRVSPEKLPQLILDQVLVFSQGTLQDDVAVLALSLREVILGPSQPAFKQERLLK